MEKYLIAICLLFVSLFGFAQESKEGEKQKPFVIDARLTVECSTPDVVFALIKSFNETPVYTALSSHPPNTVRNPIILFVNKKTGTWTLLEKVEGLVCVIATGEEFEQLRAKPVL